MIDGTVNKIISNDYADILVEYYGNQNILDKYGKDNYTILDQRYAIAHLPISEITPQFIQKYGWGTIPTCEGFLNAGDLEASGVEKIRRIPDFLLTGKGVLIGFLDSGIEYTNQVFKYADNTTKIVSIWDQTIDNEKQRPNGFPYGTEYTREQINEALQSENPLSIVPSTDNIGHGTMIAGIAAGSKIDQNKFTGVVPEAELVIVKMKDAKPYVKNFLMIPEDAYAIQVTDFQFALRYLSSKARELNQPMVICTAMGGNQGSHDGRGNVSRNLTALSDVTKLAIVIAAGNEGGRGSHYYGVIDSNKGYDIVELLVGKNVSGFIMELWGNVPNVFSVDILSPSGEFVPRIPAKIKENRVVSFMFERSILEIYSRTLEEQSANEVILFRFINPAEGVWRIRVYGSGNKMIDFHIWLPIVNFLGNDTYFIKPDANTTIVNPGNASEAITVTAYDSSNQAIYEHASKGYTTSNLVKPDIAAPGVNVTAPFLNNSFTIMNGSSAAAAHAAGIAAMLLEWGVVHGKLPDMDTSVIKKMLIIGANQQPTINYPNNVWGYGTIDIYNSFLRMQGE